jgi:2-dehydropantoate 2-reductase
MGSLFAALLSTVADVVMIGTWLKQLRVVQGQGLRLEHPDGRESRHRIVATSQAKDAWPADLALLLVKSWQTGAATGLAQESMAPNGLAITLQNGLGNLETIAAHLGSARSVQGVTSEGATLLGPGEVRHAGHGHTYFAADKTTRDRLDATAALFRKAGFATTVVDDAQSLIWGKLAINAAINPLTALLQVPNGRLLQHRLTVDIMTKAALEVATVAKQLNIILPFDDVPEQAVAVARATAENRSSMAQDIARGMPTEIEQISGAVVRHGQSLGIPTPLNEALLHLVRAQVTNGSWHEALAGLPDAVQAIFLDLPALENQE